MKTLFFVIIIIIVSLSGAAGMNVKTVPLENGVVLHIKEIAFSRILPHAYYDQAISSIPGVYPDSQIIAKRRFGYAGKNPPVVYSMVSKARSPVVRPFLVITIRQDDASVV